MPIGKQYRARVLPAAEMAKRHIQTLMLPAEGTARVPLMESLLAVAGKGPTPFGLGITGKLFGAVAGYDPRTGQMIHGFGAGAALPNMLESSGFAGHAIRKGIDPATQIQSFGFKFGGGGKLTFPNLVLGERTLGHSAHQVSKGAIYLDPATGTTKLYNAASLVEEIFRRSTKHGQVLDIQSGLWENIPSSIRPGSRAWARHVQQSITGATSRLTYLAQESINSTPEMIKATGGVRDILVGNTFVDYITRNKLQSFAHDARMGRSIESIYGEGGPGYLFLQQRKTQLEAITGGPVSFHSLKGTALQAGEWIKGRGPQDMMPWGGQYKDVLTALQRLKASPIRPEAQAIFRSGLTGRYDRFMSGGLVSETVGMQQALGRLEQPSAMYSQQVRVAMAIDEVAAAGIAGGGAEGVLISKEFGDVFARQLDPTSPLRPAGPGDVAFLGYQKGMILGQMRKGQTFLRGGKEVSVHALSMLKASNQANVISMLESMGIEAAYTKFHDAPEKLRSILEKYGRATGQTLTGDITKPLTGPLFTGIEPGAPGYIKKHTLPTIGKAVGSIFAATGMRPEDFIVTDPTTGGKYISYMANVSGMVLERERFGIFTRGNIAGGYRGLFPHRGGFKVTQETIAQARMAGRGKLADYYENLWKRFQAPEVMKEYVRAGLGGPGIKAGDIEHVFTQKEFVKKYTKDLKIWKDIAYNLEKQGGQTWRLTQEIADSELFKDLVKDGLKINYEKGSVYVPRLGLSHDLRIGDLHEEIKRTTRLLTGMPTYDAEAVSNAVKDFKYNLALSAEGKEGGLQRILKMRVGGTFWGGIGALAAPGAGTKTDPYVMLRRAEEFLQRDYQTRTSRLHKLRGRLVDRLSQAKIIEEMAPSKLRLISIEKELSRMEPPTLEALGEITERMKKGELEDFVVLSSEHFKNLSKEQKLTVYRHGGAVTMMRRYPVTSGAVEVPLLAIFSEGVGPEVMYTQQRNLLQLAADLDRDPGLIEFLHGREGFEAFQEARKTYKLDAGTREIAAAQILRQQITELGGMKGSPQVVLNRLVGALPDQESAEAIVNLFKQAHIGTAHSAVNHLGGLLLSEAVVKQELRTTGFGNKQIERMDLLVRHYFQQEFFSAKKAATGAVPANMDIFELITDRSAKKIADLKRREFEPIMDMILTQMEKGGPPVIPGLDMTMADLQVRSAYMKEGAIGDQKALARATAGVETLYKDFIHFGKTFNKRHLEELKFGRKKEFQEIIIELARKLQSPVEQVQKDAVVKAVQQADLLHQGMSTITIEAGRSGASDAGVKAANRATVEAAQAATASHVQKGLNNALTRGMQFIKKHPVGAAIGAAAAAGVMFGGVFAPDDADIREAAVENMMGDPRMRGGMLDLNAARLEADGAPSMQFVPQERIHRGPEVSNRIFERGTIESFPEPAFRPDNVIVSGRIPSSFEFAGINERIDSSLYT